MSSQEGYCRLRVSAPRIAGRARPGQFVTVRCPEPALSPRVFDDEGEWCDAAYEDPGAVSRSQFILRRPLSLHRIYDDGSLDLLFKIAGKGTRALAEVGEGDELDVLGPIGNGYDLDDPAVRTAIIVCGGVGIASSHFLASRLRAPGREVICLFGTLHEIPVAVSESSPAADFLPEGVILQADELAELGAFSRFATEQPRDGCYTGRATDLLRLYLDHRDDLNGVAVYSCGPLPMLRAVCELCDERGVSCQILMEERMACGMGACYCCVTRVRDGAGGTKNVRTCVDGPVFNSREIVW